MFRSRRISEHRIAHPPVAHHIGAQAQGIGDHRRHGRDGGRIHFPQLLNPAKDVVEFRHHRRHLCFGDSNTRQRRNFADICFVYGHVSAASRGGIATQGAQR